MKPTPMLPTLLVAAMLGSFSLVDAAAPSSSLVLAHQAKTEFSIVTPVSPSPAEALAAAELQRYLAAMSGARFELTTNFGTHPLVLCRRDSLPPGFALPAAVAQLPADGYCLARRGNVLFLVGGGERGQLYAVYNLLERLGCRWLAPALSFYAGAHETVPKLETLTLSLNQDVLEQPVLKYRKLYVEEGRSHNTTNLLQMIDWMPKRRFNTLVVPLNYAGGGRVKWDNWREALTPELRRRGIWIEVGGHGYENYLNAEMEGGRLFEQHPEWFRLDETGKRTRPPHAVFCTSNRAAKDYFTRNVIKYLDAHPEIQIFDFWPPDGAKWCQCPDCQALGTPSDRQALLLAEVAAAVHKTRPDLRFETIAYAACVAPPHKATLDPDVLVDFCPIGQCFEYQIDDPASEKNADYTAQLKDWLSSFKGDISIYSYYRKYAWHSLPTLLPHYIQNDLRAYRRLGVRGISSYAEPGDWATYELNHYVLGALAWNPDADVDVLVKEFAQARFGSQAPLALKSYRLLEEQVRHLCSLPGTTLKTPADYQRAEQTFQALVRELDAKCQTTSDQPAAAALHRLRLAVEYAQRDLSIQRARAERAGEAQRKALSDDLTRFIQAHADEGVFVANRVPAANKQKAPKLPNP